MIVLFLTGLLVAVGVYLLGMQLAGQLLFVACVALFILWALLDLPTPKPMWKRQQKVTLVGADSPSVVANAADGGSE